MYPTLVFALIFALPLFGFYLFVAQRDKHKNRKFGFVALAVMFVAAVIIAYFVNRNK